MTKFLYSILILISASTAQAELINLQSSLYMGDLYRNNHSLGQICYIQINQVMPHPAKGKHCLQLSTQWMFNLDDQGIHDRSTEIILTSRKTNSEADFHKPTTCGEVVANTEEPWKIDRWSDDTNPLYIQILNAEANAAKGKNHYTLSFEGETKTPSRAMIHNVRWFSENSFECRNLKPL